MQKNEQRAREAAEDKARENDLLRVQDKHFLEAQENEQLRESKLLRIQDDEDEARENELLRARIVHFLEAQENERLRAQDEDNAQHPEQENERLRIQAEIEHRYTVAARPEEFPKLGQPINVAVAAAEPETGTGVLCERETGSTAAAHRGFFAAERQDHYILKKDGLDKSSNNAADAPTGDTLNEPKQRAFTTGLRPHAFGTKSIDLVLPGNTLNDPEQCALTTGPRMHAYGTKSINQPRRLLPRQGQGWPPRPHPDCGRGLHYNIARGGLRQHLARRRGRVWRRAQGHPRRAQRRSLRQRLARRRGLVQRLARKRSARRPVRRRGA